MGIAWSPGDSGKTSIRAGWGLFYNPMEQLVLEQFSAEPPFGGSNIINAHAVQHSVSAAGRHGQSPIRSTAFSNPPRGQPVDWALFRPMLLYGQFQPHLRTQYSAQYNLNIQRELTKDLVLQVGYVGSQGHRLLASHDVNYGNPQTCLDLHNISDCYGDGDLDCGQFYADSAFFIARRHDCSRRLTCICPMAQAPRSFRQAPTVGRTASRWSACGRYSSPNCDPLDRRLAARTDGTPVFSSIFAQDTIANSNYNSLQARWRSASLTDCRSQLAYTFSKSIDQASSFEGELNPLDPRGTVLALPVRCPPPLGAQLHVGVADSEVLRASPARS